MLDLMRKHAGSWMVKFILAVIIIVFTFWGVGSWRAQKGNRVAVVNGEPIPLQEYQEAYNNMLERLRRQFGASLNDDMLKMLNVEEQTLNQLIDQRLLLQEAQRLDLQVTDAELAEFIKRYGAFQSGGAFSMNRYRRVLANYRMTPEGFEISQRRSMLIEKLQKMIFSGIVVSDAEARAWYDWRNTQMRVDYAVFSPKAHDDIALGDADLKAYYESHKERYTSPPAVKVKYLFFDPEHYAAKVNVTEDDIGLYYDNHLDQFRTPKTVKARHILIKVAEDAPEEAVEAARKRIVEVEQLARGGEDFAELAKKYSEGPSSERGGDLGTFKKEDMVPAFAEKAFSMKAGEISEPVRTRFGWHLIKVEAVHPETTQPLAKVKNSIRDQLIRDRRLNKAYEAAEQAFSQSYAGADLVEISQDAGLPVKTTGFFDRKGPADGIKKPAAFAEEAFALHEGEISDVIDAGEGFYLMQLMEKRPELQKPYDAVQPQVTEDLKKERTEAAAKADAEAFLSRLRAGTPWADAVAESSVPAKTSELFKRSGTIAEIGYAPDLVAAAFELSADAPYPEKVFKTQKGYDVIRFHEVVAADPLGFEAEKPEIVKALVQQKQQQTYKQLVATLRDKSEITISDRFAHRSS